MSSGNTCVVFNCANSSVKIKQWKKEECEIHRASTAGIMLPYSGLMNESSFHSQAQRYSETLQYMLFILGLAIMNVSL